MQVLCKCKCINGKCVSAQGDRATRLVSQPWVVQCTLSPFFTAFVFWGRFLLYLYLYFIFGDPFFYECTLSILHCIRIYIWGRFLLSSFPIYCWDYIYQNLVQCTLHLYFIIWRPFLLWESGPVYQSVLPHTLSRFYIAFFVLYCVVWPFCQQPFGSNKTKEV